MNNFFKEYSKEKPPERGLYIFRVPHNTIKDVVIDFVAKYRKRNAGQERIFTPEFDHWDGYKIILPEHIFWKNYSGDKIPAGKENQYEKIHITYNCKQMEFIIITPDLKAIRKGDY